MSDFAAMFSAIFWADLGSEQTVGLIYADTLMYMISLGLRDVFYEDIR